MAFLSIILAAPLDQSSPMTGFGVAAWTIIAAALTCLGGGIAMLVAWGMMRKMEKELQPRLESIEKERKDGDRSLHGRIDTLRETTQARIETLKDGTQDKIDELSHQTVELHHSVEIENAKLNEQMKGVREFQNQLIERIDVVENRMNQSLKHTENVILSQLNKDQKEWKEGLSELKAELRRIAS